MKKLALCLFLLLAAQGFFGQRMTDQVTMIWNDLVWDVYGDPKFQAAFEVEDAYLVFRKHPIRGPWGFKYFLEKLDSKLNRVSFTDISDDIDEKNHYVEEIFEFAGRFYIITSAVFKDISKIEYYLQEVIWKSGRVGKREKIFEYTYEGRRPNTDLYVRHSPSEEHLLLVHELPSSYKAFLGTKKEADKRSFIVYNSEMSIVHKEDMIPMEYTEDEYTIIQTVVSDKGAVYMLGSRVFKERGDERELSILKFRDGNLLANKINFKEGRLADIMISINKDETLYCGGYYNEDQGRGSGYGVVVMTVDPETAEPMTVSTKLIDKEMLVEGVSDREKARMDKREDAGKAVKQLANITAREVVNHADGTASLIGERYYVVVTTTTNANGGTTTHTTYHYNELYISRVNQDGEIISTIKMPKKNASLGSRSIAYHAYDKNNDLGIIFNDHLQNLIEIGPRGILPYARKAKVSALTLVTVDPDGQQIREGIIDYSQKPQIAYRHYAFERDMAVLNNKTLLFITYYGKKKFGYMKMGLK